MQVHNQKCEVGERVCERDYTVEIKMMMMMKMVQASLQGTTVGRLAKSEGEVRLCV